MKKNKKSVLITMLGLILIVIGFLVHLTNRYRLVFIACGFVIQVIGMVMNSKKKIIVVPVIILLFGSCLVLIDYGLVKKFSKLPIFAIRNTISSNTKIYNALFYRVWKCNISDKKIYVDEFYKSNFYCDSSELKKVDINEFLLHYQKKYNKYKNDFVKIEGKVSAIEGIKILEMKAYTQEVDKLNGYVVFDDNVKLRFAFNGNEKKLAKYSVYDNIKVIGRITSMKKNKDNEYTIFLKDSKIVDTDHYDTFEIVADTINRCSDQQELYYETKNQKYYYDCINKFSIKYNDEDIYELNYLLLDDKIKMDDIYAKAQEKEENEDGSILYKFGDFRILKCDASKGNNDIIIGNNNLIKRDNMCNPS